MDVLHVMKLDTGMKIKELRVDGGASANNLLMQFQADILQTTVIRPKVIETTAMGAAYLAGLATGFWKDTEEIRQQWQPEKQFEPAMPDSKVMTIKRKWADAVKRAKSWTR
jgi:glycerol kinase